MPKNNTENPGKPGVVSNRIFRGWNYASLSCLEPVKREREIERCDSGALTFAFARTGEPDPDKA